MNYFQIIGIKGEKGFKGEPYDSGSIRRPFPGYDGLRGAKVTCFWKISYLFKTTL